jgi:hypothetical protein
MRELNSMNDIIKMFKAMDEIGFGIKHDVFYKLECIKDFIEYHGRVAFEDGARVELVKTPTINENEGWGWLSARHILKEGCKGTVSDAFWGKPINCFCYSFTPDEHTWIDSDRVVHQLKKPKTFSYFSHDYFRRAG